MGAKGQSGDFFCYDLAGRHDLSRILCRLRSEKKEVTQFYDEILGLKIDDGTYDKMLSGSGIRNASDASGG